MVGGSGEGGGAGCGEAAMRRGVAWVSGCGLNPPAVMVGLDPPPTVMAGLDPAIGFQQAQCDGQNLRVVGEAGQWP